METVDYIKGEHENGPNPGNGKPQREQSKTSHPTEPKAAVETKENLKKGADPRKVKAKGEEHTVKVKRSKKMKVNANVSIELGFVHDEPEKPKLNHSTKSANLHNTSCVSSMS